MFYIYHIPGVKIGCTNNLQRRIKEQKFNHYELLEEHLDKLTASIRESELQKQYGYKVDYIKYHQGKYSEAGLKGAETNTKNGWNKKWQKIGTKIQSEKRKKTLLQYDLEGNFIKEWNCGSNNMPDEFKCAGSAANSNSKNFNRTLYGFQWRYKTSKDYPKQIDKFENDSFQKVIQKDLKGNIIKIWDNQTEASQSVGCSVQLISRVCRGIGKTAKGFIWEKYV